MKKKTTSKVTATPAPEPVKATASEVKEVVKQVPKIAKLEPFGNEEMHKLVAKINELIDHAI